MVERMRPMSDILAVRANNRGSLRLSINTESVKVDTEWTGCQNPKSMCVYLFFALLTQGLLCRAR